MLTSLRRAIKPALARTVYRPGAVRSIFWGPSRGLRYRIFPGYGLAPLYGGWEREVQRVLAIYLKPGAVAYDIGANYGIHTLLMARLVGPGGHVYAFEPVPEIGACLREHVALNGFRQVSCVSRAVAERSGTAAFASGHNSAVGHLQAERDVSMATMQVGMVSIDTFIFEQGHRPPDLIKIDVEGAESRVLAGARRTLATYGPMLVVELHTPEQDRAVGRLIAEAGYSAFRLGDGSRVQDLSSGWPDPAGLWGQFFASRNDIR